MQHKWHKEIISYLNGEKVYGRMDTHKSIIAEFEVNKLSQFDVDNYSFYIKPQPKEPQYLYVYETGFNAIAIQLSLKDNLESYKCIGKIKLEVDDV